MARAHDARIGLLRGKSCRNVHVFGPPNGSPTPGPMPTLPQPSLLLEGSERAVLCESDAVTSAVRVFVEERLDVLGERWEVTLDGVPDDVEVDAPILVYENVSLTSR